MARYNTTFMNDTTSIATFYEGVNTASNDVLSSIILVVIWVVVFIALKHFDTKVVFLSSSVTTTLVGLFFLSLGWISLAIFMIPLVLTMFSLLGFWLSKD